MANSEQIKIQATAVFDRIRKSTKKIVVNQGSTRSSKTYSICQYWICKLLEEEGKVLTIVRKTMPSLKTSAMRDFIEILNNMGLYDERLHNKTDSTYKLHGNLVEFLSIDQPQKKKGSKRDYLWLNEANELTFNDYVQLAIRTTGRIFLDYNPSMEFHWIYDKIIPRNDCEFIRSTYKDNPFLQEEQIREIEFLKEANADLWRVYGLGLKGVSKARIFTDWEEIDSMPEKLDMRVYGVDFGFNNPSALIDIGLNDNRDLYLDEIIYQDRLTNPMLVDKMKEEKVNKKQPMIADSAEPDRISEIYGEGYNILPVKKLKNGQKKFVKDSIDKVQRRRIFVTKRSVNLIKELKGYTWMIDKDENVLDDPVPFMDHAIAGIRYGNIYICQLLAKTRVQKVQENVPKDKMDNRAKFIPQGVIPQINIIKNRTDLHTPENTTFRGDPM